MELKYSLAELPSSQHRAGLAGLVLVLEHLKAKEKTKTGVLELKELGPRGATLEMTKEGLGIIFDEIYAASVEEVAREQPFKDKKGNLSPYLRTEEREKVAKNGKVTRKTFYVYNQVIPRGSFLLDRDPTSDGKVGLWIKLWRDMIWQILRGPQSRGGFEARAKGEPPEDLDDTWADLERRAPKDTVSLSSTFYLGAQAATAENVDFKDRASFQFLLHFWPFAAQIYCPEVVDATDGKPSFVGYAVTVPDVLELRRFTKALPTILSQRGKEIAGYLPRGAVVSVASESALDIASWLDLTVGREEGAKGTAPTVLGFDVLHVEKQGNNVRTLSQRRVEPTPVMIDRYRIIRQTLWDREFRRQRLMNLLESSDWWRGFDAFIETRPYETHTIGSRTFCHDAQTSFVGARKTEDYMAGETKPPRDLDEMVYDLVGGFISRRAKAKSGLDWDAVKQNDKSRGKWNEVREKIGRDAFLAVRSRTGADFSEYFSGTLCSVPQFLREAEFSRLSRALRDTPEQVRTLTLLALSAHAYSSSKEKKEETAS